MADAPIVNSKEADEALSNFTDQLLAGTAPNLLTVSSDPEIAQLQKMVLQLNQAVGRNPLTPTVSNKIWDNLAVQWQKEEGRLQANSFWQRLKNGMASFRSTLISNYRRTIYVSLAGVTTVVLLIIWGSGLTDNTPLPAATGSGNILVPLVLLIGLIGVGVLGWWFNHKR